MQLVGSQYDPTASAPSQKINPFYGYVPIADAYLQKLLTAGSAANSWYLIADKAAADPMVVIYLSGNRTPTVRQEPSRVGMALGIAYDCYFDWGVTSGDWRGIIYNDGK
jgi:hypothetical protein